MAPSAAQALAGLKPDKPYHHLPITKEEAWNNGVMMCWVASPFPVLQAQVDLPKETDIRLAVETTVPLSSLFGTQPNVTINGMDKKRDDSHGLPLVVRSRGVDYIQDGHHRLAEEFFSGATSSRVRFVSLDQKAIDDFPLSKIERIANRWFKQNANKLWDNPFELAFTFYQEGKAVRTTDLVMGDVAEVTLPDEPTGTILLGSLHTHVGCEGVLSDWDMEQGQAIANEAGRTYAMFVVGPDEDEGESMMMSSEVFEPEEPDAIVVDTEPPPQPPVLNLEQFARLHGLISDGEVQGHVHAGLRSKPPTKTFKRFYEGRLQGLQEASAATKQAYEEAIQRGDIRRPDPLTMEDLASGHPDNVATQAALRVLAKRAAKVEAMVPTEDAALADLPGIQWSFPSDAELLNEVQTEYPLEQLFIYSTWPKAGEYSLAVAELKVCAHPEDLDPKTLKGRHQWPTYAALRETVTSFGGPKDPDGMVRAIREGKPLPMPVVTRLESGELEVFGGNTRTGIALLAGQVVTALVVDAKTAKQRMADRRLVDATAKFRPGDPDLFDAIKTYYLADGPTPTIPADKGFEAYCLSAEFGMIAHALGLESDGKELRLRPDLEVALFPKVEP